MPSELVLTILIPFCIMMIALLAMFVVAKLKKRRNRRTIERGIADFVRQSGDLNRRQEKLLLRTNTRSGLQAGTKSNLT